MKYYIELTLIPNDETGLPFLWSKLFTQLHLALVEIQDADAKVPLGVGFVNYRAETHNGQTFGTLGSRLRLFAPNEATFQQLNLDKWLARLTDYIHIKSIKPIPEQVGFVTVNRSRAKPPSQKENAAYAKRRNISEAEALAHYENSNQLKNLPFIKLKSLTNANDFSLTIEQKPATAPQPGTFSTYGLSATSTVPHW